MTGTHGPIEQEAHAEMNAIAQALREYLPADYGFALLVFKYGDTGRMNYIASAERGDMIAAMKELISRFEGTHPEEH